MNAVPPPIMTPILATPFGVAPLAEASALNPVLLALFAERLAASPHMWVNPLCLRSGQDLFDWGDECVVRMRNAMLQGVCSVVSSVNELTEAQFRELRLESRAWLTVVKPDGHVAAAVYPLSAWCAVYCVAAPAVSDTRSDSGVLRLYESRLATTFQDASNSALRFPFKAAHYAWRPVPGEMAVFPASVRHEIALLRAPGELVLVTAQVRFVAPGQQGLGRW